jgi:S-formylglutathione hydrolase FrmB
MFALMTLGLVGLGLLFGHRLAPPRREPATTAAGSNAIERVTVPPTAVATTVRTRSVDRFGRVQIQTLDLGPRLGTRTVWVYRPAVPDSVNLSVVYFLHGVPGTPADVFTKAHLVGAMDRYLAAGGRPFVVASLDGRGRHHHDTEWADAVDGSDPVASIALGPELAAVEGKDRRDGEHRAITGYSMGGYGAMNLAMTHRGMFGQVVAIGGYFHVDDPDAMLGTSPATIAANSPDRHPGAALGVRLLLMDGTGDHDASARGQTTAFAATLTAAHVPVTADLLPGGHTWAFVTATIPRLLAFLAAGWTPEQPAA